MGYVEGANASNLQCLEYLSQHKCLSSLHKGSQWALFATEGFARIIERPIITLQIIVHVI